MTSISVLQLNFVINIMKLHLIGNHDFKVVFFSLRNQAVYYYSSIPESIADIISRILFFPMEVPTSQQPCVWTDAQYVGF